MTGGPISVMRKIRPECQRHLFSDDRTAQVQQALGILPGTDAPALEGPFPVKGIQAKTVNHIAGAEAGFIPGLHVGGAVGKEICIATHNYVIFYLIKWVNAQYIFI